MRRFHKQFKIQNPITFGCLVAVLANVHDDDNGPTIMMDICLYRDILYFVQMSNNVSDPMRSKFVFIVMLNQFLWQIIDHFIHNVCLHYMKTHNIQTQCAHRK